MSHTLFTRTAVLRTAARRSIQHTQSTAYHSRPSSPKMPASQHHLRALIRQTTLRASTTTLQRTSYPVSQHLHTQPCTRTRTRSPSPPPRYEARNTTLLAPTSHWTRFTTPSSLSSVRTFHPAPKIQWPASTAPDASPTALSPAAQKRVDAIVEHIADLYGTAKDEFDIASKESAKNSTYAADDRAAAREELDKLLEYFEGVSGEGDGVGGEVRRRVGQRIRELEAGIVAMEEAALHGD